MFLPPTHFLLFLVFFSLSSFSSLCQRELDLERGADRRCIVVIDLVLLMTVVFTNEFVSEERAMLTVQLDCIIVGCFSERCSVSLWFIYCVKISSQTFKINIFLNDHSYSLTGQHLITIGRKRRKKKVIESLSFSYYAHHSLESPHFRH